jgi:N-acetylneuraminic acid mutarotase
VSIDGNVYVVGGKDGHTCLKSAEVYDTSTGQWRALPDMSTARYGCAAVSIDGNVYVVGGSDGHTALKSAEMYETSTGQWRVMPDMRVGRNECAALCLEGSVYVVGGSESSEVYTVDGLKSAEVYDTSTRHWRTLPEMTVGRTRCAVLCLEGHVSVVGGSDDYSSHRSSEMYCPAPAAVGPLPAGTRVLVQQLVAMPEHNGKYAHVIEFDTQSGHYVVELDNDDWTDDDCTALSLKPECVRSTGEWLVIPAMGSKRSFGRDGCATVCVVGNHDELYVVGGKQFFSPQLETAECYDPFTDEWRKLPSMKTARWYCAAVAVDATASVCKVARS